MYQELLAITYDCDGDALRFSVIQKGEPPSFCHLMTRTCWGNTGGIQKLENILVDRKKSAPVGSYTKRLFDDPNLLQKKLLEECQELIEATDPDHVAAEAADVMYFMMTRCVAAGVGLKDIEKHLDKRTLKVTRRPGNAKEWRTQNAKQILSEK
jgi:phosphoribosyl-ATP pyrophosphohydrolase/phosphoribosyl-AMP cyclohydrolase/histidinol dehydrogenase